MRAVQKRYIYERNIIFWIWYLKLKGAKRICVYEVRKLMNA